MEDYMEITLTVPSITVNKKKHGFYYHNNYSSVNICCRIQRIWRGFLARKFVKQKREEELTFIGMVSMAHQSIYSETHKHEE